MHLDRINVFYHKALGGKYVPRAVLLVLELGVIGSVKTGPNTIKQVLRKNASDPPCSVVAFVVNSEPCTGPRTSVRLCVEPELARCVHKHIFTFPDLTSHDFFLAPHQTPISRLSNSEIKFQKEQTTRYSILYNLPQFSVGVLFLL
jgi:hypothetical protein